MDESTLIQAENLFFSELFSLIPVSRKPVEVRFTTPDLGNTAVGY